jgi:hypothetical protein
MIGIGKPSKFILMEILFISTHTIVVYFVLIGNMDLIHQKAQKIVDNKVMIIEIN